MALSLLPAGLVVLALILGGLRIRSRLGALPVLPSGATTDAEEYRVVTAAGVTVDDGVRRAAAAYAIREGLAAVDLVPPGLPVVAALELARSVEPKTYRTDRLGSGRTAGHAVVVTDTLLSRAGVTETVGLDPASFIRLADRLKMYAITGVDLAVAPGLPAVAPDPTTRQARLRARGRLVLLDLIAPIVGYGVLAAAVVVNPGWGWIGLVSYSLQPYLATVGTPIRPGDRHRAAVLRLLASPVRWWQEIRGRWRSPYDIERDTLGEQARAEYAADLVGGVDRFFEPRRDTCPWCGDNRLATLLSTPDRIQAKPGRFVLDRCRACRHVFQNPRLTLAGLDFYYRDMYDRLGEDAMHMVFGQHAPSYNGRAEMVRRFAEPGTWLDVGTGHGHFCAYAAARFPDTVFDGLDISASIEEAQRRGWVVNGYRGLFPDLVDKLADSYDVVSMHHYLEHTLDPRIELAAAARVVRPGGHLLIELPNPASRLGRLLGSFWIPWFQPEHLNLPPLGNLEVALREHGLEPVAVDQGRAHQTNDFSRAAFLLMNSIAPDPDRPWAARPGTPARRALRGLVFTVGFPFAAAGWMLDHVVALALRRGHGGNCYRVLARRVERAG